MARAGGLLVWMEAHKARTRGIRSGLISSLIAQIMASARSGEPAPDGAGRLTAQVGDRYVGFFLGDRYVPVTVRRRDWGGSGRPIVLLAGFGGTAHDLDVLARRFASGHRVVAITRRGFGRSSHPAATEANYTPERLGADIMAVIRRMRLVRPVIAGHSIAGQELSEIGTRYPEEIGGLVYLEAANSQAYHGPRSEVLYPIAAEVRRDLGRLISAQPSEARALVGKLRAELARLRQGLDWYERALEGAADRPAEVQSSPGFAVQSAMVHGARIYMRIDVPILAIATVPPQCARDCETPAYRRRAAEASAQAAAFEASNPGARLVRIPMANHFIWVSNGAEVEREMNAFLDSLERQRPHD